MGSSGRLVRLIMATNHPTSLLGPAGGYGIMRWWSSSSLVGGIPTPYTEVENWPAWPLPLAATCGRPNGRGQRAALDGPGGTRWSPLVGQVCIPHSDLPPGELMVNGYAIHGPPGERHYSVVTTLGG